MKGDMACTRVPFFSDAVCDRGDVDINQFSDFPFCDIFSPSEPPVPPELAEDAVVVDMPVDCTCVNITHKMSPDRSAASEFQSISDCCLGNYLADLRVDVPCPLGDNKKAKMSMSVSYGCQESAAPEQLLEYNGSCSVEAKDVDFNLCVPCPVTGAAGGINASLHWGEDSEIVPFRIIPNEDDCSLSVESGTFNIGIPCVLNGIDETLDIELLYCDFESEDDVAMVVGIDHVDDNHFVSCSFNVESSDFNLCIPCPIVPSVGKLEVSAGLKSGRSEEKSVQVLKVEECSLKALSGSLDLDVPCPIGFGSGGLSIETIFGEKIDTVSIVDVSDCYVAPLLTDLKVNVPCPVAGGNGELSASIRYGDKKTAAGSVVSVDGCSISANNDHLDVQVPCPLVPGTGTLSASLFQLYSETAGSPASATVATASGCNLNVSDGDLALGLPSFFFGASGGSMDVTLEYGDTPPGQENQIGMSVSKSVDCAIDVSSGKVSLKLPCPTFSGGGEMGMSLKYSSSGSDGVLSGTGMKIMTSHNACSVYVTPGDIDLEIPCPVKSTGSSLSISASLNASSSTASATLVTSSVCSVDSVGAALQLNPFHSCTDSTGKIDAALKYVSDSGTASAQVARVQFCGVEPSSPSLDIPVECPFTAGTYEYKMELKRDKDSCNTFQIFGRRRNDCRLDIDETTFDLGVDPLFEFGNLSVDYNISYADAGEDGSFDIVQYGENSCKDSITFNIKFPTTGPKGDDNDTPGDDGKCIKGPKGLTPGLECDGTDCYPTYNGKRDDSQKFTVPLIKGHNGLDGRSLTFIDGGNYGPKEMIVYQHFDNNSFESFSLALPTLVYHVTGLCDLANALGLENASSATLSDVAGKARSLGYEDIPDDISSLSGLISKMNEFATG